MVFNIRAVVQRVSHAQVTVAGLVTGSIEEGIVVLLGVAHEDNDRDIAYMGDKIVNLRIFEDQNGKMNLSLLDKGGALLVVSQFTLYGDCRKGKRPSYDRAARPEYAENIYEKFVEYCKRSGIRVETGKFQAEMMVEIHNDGPVTLMLDSKKEF